MDQMAIVVDGTETSIRGQTIGFAGAALPRPGGPLVGLAIAIVTAVVTMGAVGPRPPDLAGVGPACQTEHAAPVVEVFVSAPPGDATSSAATSSPVPWWLMPQMAEWVDPATARSMQASVEREQQVGHDPHVAR